MRRDRRRCVQFDDADRAHHPNVPDARQDRGTARALGRIAAAIAATCARRGSRSNRSSEALAAAQASALAMKVGPCISACGGSSDQKASNTLAARHRRGKRQGAAGQRLRQRHDVGRNAGRLAGEQVAGAAEAGEDLVEDQQQVVAIGRRAQAPQHRRLVEQHAAGALHQRLDDDAGDRRRRGAPTSASNAAMRSRSSCGSSTISCSRQQPAKQRVHAVIGIADRHGAGGVAVIAALEGDELVRPRRRD